jgi:hypothetical protein
MIAFWAVFAAFREKMPSQIFLFSGRREAKYDKIHHDGFRGASFG